MAFSLKKNFAEMISTKISGNEVAVLNGIRTLITLLMALSHKLMLFYYYTISNRNVADKAFDSYPSILFRSIFFSTEAFLMLSGFLTAYTIMGKLNQKKKVNILREILMRYFRFMPSVIAIIFFYAYVTPLLGDGPQWPLLMTHQSDLCKKYYWRNIFMIHNWFPFENMCMFNLHHIGTDFMLFIFATTIIVTLHKNLKILFSTLTVIGIFSAIATFLISYVEELVTYMYYGVP